MKSSSVYIAVVCLLGLTGAFHHPFLSICCFIILILFLYDYKFFSFRVLVSLCILYALFYFRGESVEKLNKTLLSGNEKLFNIVFSDEFDFDGNVFSAVVKDGKTGEKIAVRYQIQSEKQLKLLKSFFQIGTSCKVHGILEKPSSSTNPNQFDYRNYLRHQSIFWSLEITDINLSECKKVNKGILISIKNVRSKGIQYIYKYFPKESAPLANALIFGERNQIEPDHLKAYQKLGIVHILAISGLHVAMLIGIIFYVGVRIGITREKNSTILIIFLPLYILLTGATPSVIRAGVMYWVVLIIQKITKTKLATADLISYIFALYIFLSPFVIYDIGFQLSFLVTVSLILSTSIFVETFHPLSLSLYTSIFAQVSSTPILLYYFYETSIISVIANVLFVPLFSFIILPLVLFGFFLHLALKEMVDPFFTLINFIVDITNDFAEHFSRFQYATIVLGRPSTLLLLLYLISIPFFFILWEKSRGSRTRFGLIIVPVSVLLIQGFLHPALSGKGQVTFIDIGQGDSIFIRLPHNKGNYLIDTGGTMKFQVEAWERRKDPFEVGKDVLVPTLKSMGIKRIDKLILTHGDADHIGGSIAVISEMPVKEIVLPSFGEKSALENTIKQMARELLIPVKYVQKGDSWQVDDFLFRVLSPGTEVKSAERNDQSIVLYAELAGKRWLFTGDLEQHGEENLISSFPNLRVDIIKIGHHGSKTSTSARFLEVVKPRVAIISVGNGNRYGHPHQEIIKRLKDQKIKIFRTDKQGAIFYNFEKDAGTFSTQLP